jgi:HTH-type transcriptional regulator/antitoxin HigA
MSFEMKVIKTDQEYNSASEELSVLMENDPQPGSKNYEKMELLLLLIEAYEKDHVDIGLPDPIEAIRYRMAEYGMKNRDLVTIIGSPVKVSEVLNRKRKLTFEMMQALSNTLSIPPAVFFQYQPHAKMEDPKQLSAQIPVREMIKKRWIQGIYTSIELKNKIEEIQQSFFSNQDLFSFAFTGNAVMLKKQHIRKGSNIDPISLASWEYMALDIASHRSLQASFKKGFLSPENLRKLACLSVFPDGMKQAQAFLSSMGIHLIILPHLKKTHIDGAAMLIPKTKIPVIALTLRHDRIDNFWFCLFHELGHVRDHLTDVLSIAENLDVIDENDQIEKEADEFACNHLIPLESWNIFYQEGKGDFSPASVIEFARSIDINPAIVAGRVRCITRQWKLLSRMVGHHEVRKVFGAEYYSLA